MGVSEQFNKTRACAVSLEILGCKISHIRLIPFSLLFERRGLFIGELSNHSRFGCFCV